jgi:Ca-activated chloride channel homolog
MWRFNNPSLLSLTLVIPVIIWIEYTIRDKPALFYSSIHPLKGPPKRYFYSPRGILLLLRSLALIFLILALARPQTGRSSTEIPTQGIDIVLALDTSGSMQAMDFEIENKWVNRLDVVKQVVARFIKGRKNDRIGMVVFAENAYTQCPLTLDYEVLARFLDRVQIGMAGDGTAVGSALATAVKRLRDSQAKSKVVILLTDGRNNAGAIDPEAAAKLAKSDNIKVYCIGAGTKGTAPFVVDSPFGERTIYQKVDLDEDSLKRIARITGGEYFRATDTEGMEASYKKIDAMEKTPVKVKEYQEYTEHFTLFLVLGIFLLGIEVFLGNTWLRVIP